MSEYVHWSDEYDQTEDNNRAIDLLVERLKRSFKCAHPLAERYVYTSSMPDTNETREQHRCGICKKTWDVWPEDAA